MATTQKKQSPQALPPRQTVAHSIVFHSFDICPTHIEHLDELDKHILRATLDPFLADLPLLDFRRAIGDRKAACAAYCQPVLRRFVEAFWALTAGGAAPKTALFSAATQLGCLPPAFSTQAAYGGFTSQVTLQLDAQHFSESAVGQTKLAAQLQASLALVALIDRATHDSAPQKLWGPLEPPSCDPPQTPRFLTTGELHATVYNLLHYGSAPYLPSLALWRVYLRQEGVLFKKAVLRAVLSELITEGAISPLSDLPIPPRS